MRQLAFVKGIRRGNWAMFVEHRRRVFLLALCAALLALLGVVAASAADSPPAPTAELSDGTLTLTDPGATDQSLHFSLSNGTYTFEDTGGATYSVTGGAVDGGGTSTISADRSAVQRIVVHLGGGSDSLTFDHFDAPIAPFYADSSDGGAGDHARIASPVTVAGQLTLKNFWTVDVDGRTNVDGPTTFLAETPLTFAANFTSANTISVTTAESGPTSQDQDDITGILA